jgi:hypothetical protein
MIQPWHLWGGQQVVNHTHVAAAPPQQTFQLSRISYKRPESWRWMFVAAVDSSDSAGGTLTVNWELTIGIGRASVTLANFDAFTFLFPLAVTPNQIFAANVIGPTRTTGLVPPNQSSVFDEIVAENIQLRARVAFGGLTVGSVTNLTLSSFFAPSHHERPDWFAGKFGEELNGS